MSKKHRSPRVRQTSATADSTDDSDGFSFSGLSVPQTVFISGVASGLAAGSSNWAFDQFVKAPKVAVKKVVGNGDE